MLKFACQSQDGYSERNHGRNGNEPGNVNGFCVCHGILLDFWEPYDVIK